MKVIFSKKGFNKSIGQRPNPIMPDGTLLAVPLPGWHSVLLRKLESNGLDMEQIFEDLAVYDFYDSGCHLDPDIRPELWSQGTPKGWRAIYGQTGTGHKYLKKQGVGVGDLFVFYAWFRPVEKNEENHLRYVKNTKDADMIYGYMQVGELAHGDELLKYEWHPHTDCYIRDDERDTVLYLASDKLVIDGVDTGLPGFGAFKYSESLELTMPGQTKSNWKLPDFFKDVRISRHDADSFKPEGYFQVSNRCEDFVVDDDPRVTEWIKDILIKNSNSVQN